MAEHVGVASVARQMKLESSILAATSVDVRNAALACVRDALRKEADAIFSANAEDLAAAEAAGLAPAVMARLRFDAHKLDGVCAGIDDLIRLADPVGRILLSRELDQNLTLTRLTCPIGVIGVIFEARPDALVQIAALCVKSGNCALLKGGSETAHTNRALFDVIHRAIVDAGLPRECLALMEDRSDVTELLACDDSVDLIIPRGSNEFVRFIMDHTRIPVMGHADGICHIYVDAAADLAMAVHIVVDAKAQYPAVCNAVETVLVDRAIAQDFLPSLSAAFDAQGVTMRGTDEVASIVVCEPATESDWDTEYLDLIVSIKLVDGVDEAIKHINVHGSHHTDAIVTEDAATAARFMALVDSAGVYHNVSTRFADGYRYGFGAEVGIATGKLHARGPVGLDGLVTYKYQLVGNGHTVAPYVTGERSFHFRDLD